MTYSFELHFNMTFPLQLKEVNKKTI